MSAVSLVLSIVICALILIPAEIKETGKPRPPKITMRCPSCGSPAEVKGDRWECGWCGNSGKIK